MRFIRTVCSLRGRLRGPPSLRVRSQCPTSAAIGAGSTASRAWMSEVKEGDPVVVQEPGEAEDLSGAGDAQVPGVQGW